MRRLVGVCLLALVVAVGCGPSEPMDLPDDPVDPGPGYGSLTGDWTGHCCVGADGGLIGSGHSWYVHMKEDGDGELSGTFTQVASGTALIPHPPSVVTGTVAGGRRGPEVALEFTFDGGGADGPDVRFEGLQASPDRFDGNEDISSYTTMFSRSEVDLSPGFQSLPLTGEWWGSCCDASSDVPDRFSWHLNVMEDDVGDITGTVRLHVDDGGPRRLDSSGTVAGRRVGADIVLEFSYTAGSRAGTGSRFVGRRTHPGGFRGADNTNPAEVTCFDR